MMGVLSAQYVKLSLKPKIRVGKAVKPIQSYLDQSIPGILPIAIVFLIYYLITKKKVKYTTILNWCFSLLLARCCYKNLLKCGLQKREYRLYGRTNH